MSIKVIVKALEENADLVRAEMRLLARAPRAASSDYLAGYIHGLRLGEHLLAGTASAARQAYLGIDRRVTPALQLIVDNDAAHKNKAGGAATPPAFETP